MERAPLAGCFGEGVFMALPGTARAMIGKPVFRQLAIAVGREETWWEQ
jgi:hypothetical protein